jgi:hypothetical protein
MVRIPPNWQYNLSTPLVEAAGSVSRSVAATVMIWLPLAKACCCSPSQLVVGTTPLARAQAVVRSNVWILSASSVGLCWGKSYGWATVIARLPASLPRHCVASRSASSCLVQAHACCLSQTVYHLSRGSSLSGHSAMVCGRSIAIV